MANIFHRPMFRRGGSVGTGITSGLEPRKKFQEGGSMDPEEAAAFDLMMKEKGIGPYSNPSIADLTTGELEKLQEEKVNLVDATLEDIYKTTRPDQKISDQTLPEVKEEQDAPVSETGYADSTIKQELGDIFTGLAATTPEDPTQLQSYAQVLGKAGTVSSGLKRERAAAEADFQKELILQQLKNVKQGDEAQVIRLAKQYAEITGMSEEEAIKMFLDRELYGPFKEDTYTRDLRQQEIDKYSDPTNPVGGYTKSQAIRIADTLMLMYAGQTPLANVAPRKGFTEKLPLGEYIDPNDGKIYTWDGENKTQIWPTEE